jgi:DNA-binding helix-hairpin-helix protein with protein kinase domain
VYFTDAGDACKVYKTKKATMASRRKLEFMVKHPVGHPRVCWPSDIVRAPNGEFIGYTMAAARGQRLSEAVTLVQAIREAFPDWTRRDLVRLALRICTIVEFLHANNVLLGDLNDDNIMIDEEGGPWFIDTDSYQVGEFPSPVGRLPFVHPDLIGKDLKHVFRTFEEEWFSLATLVFMILFLGTNPYGIPGSETQVADHRDRLFPFRMKREGDPRLGDRKCSAAAGFIWSNLPNGMRQAFWAVFREEKEKVAKLAPGETPLNATFWKGQLEDYLTQLDRGAVSDELLPTRFRDVRPKPGEVVRRCEGCAGDFHVDPTSSHQFCPTCRRIPEERPCAVPGCRRPVIRYRYERQVRGPQLCTFHQRNPEYR